MCVPLCIDCWIIEFTPDRGKEPVGGLLIVRRPQVFTEPLVSIIIQVKIYKFIL